MSRYSFFYLAFFFLLSTVLIVSFDLPVAFGQDFEDAIASTCDGSIGECNLDAEFLADSETTRRILAARKTYISYGALSANRVPCSRAGRSYYNCRGSGPVNPYRRGCSRITRCLRDTS